MLNMCCDSVHLNLITAAAIASTPVCFPWDAAPTPVRPSRCLVVTPMTFPIISDSALMWRCNQVSRELLTLDSISDCSHCPNGGWCLWGKKTWTNLIPRIFQDWILYIHLGSINTPSVWRHQLFTTTTTRGHSSCREESITSRSTWLIPY